MEGYKLKDLKSKEFDSIQEMFDRAFKRVNTFEDFRTKLVEGKEKRAGEELMQENAKKQKVEDDKETAELKQCLEIILNEEEVTIDAIPLAIKSLKIIMAQSQSSADVHKDELCLPNKRYALIDANKKVDLENPLCLDESRILADLLKNHPLRFSIAASSSVPWIYLGKFWHTLHEDRSKDTLKFMLDRKELTLTLDDFRTSFHLPQAIDNNHDHFVPALTFSEMVSFYINNLDFIKLIVSHYMIAYPEISRRVRDRYHNMADDVMIKSIFNSGKSKGIVGMKIPDWMITDEMKFMEDYRLYAEVFGVDVPMTHLAEQKSHEELEATQNVEKAKEHLIAEEIEKLVEGSENVDETVEDTSSPLRNDDNQIDLGTRLEPMSDKESPEVENIIDISQPMNAIEEEEESAEDDYKLRRREKGKHVKEIRNTPSPTTIRSPRIPTNLVSSDTEKFQELTKTDTLPLSSTPSSSSPKSKLSATNRLLSLFKAKPGRFRYYKSFFQELQGRYGYLFEHLSTKFMPRRKFNALAKNLEDIMMESLPKLVDGHIKKILQTHVPLHVAQGIILEREKSQADVTKMIAEAIQQEHENLLKSYMTRHILHVHPAKDPIPSAQEQQYQLYLTMKDDPQLQKDDVSIWLALKIKFERLQVATTPCRPSAVRPRDQDDPHDDAHPNGENSAKSQKTSEYGTFEIRGSSSG
ncbi:hypothetical protein Tco_1523624 [Tanacetum coccineum]